ncbi:hypothetical protein [Psychrobacillus lasiicapitis]|nr:hypothetical protein [Psychrobacillus lasiicapitis]GGA32032.1 hypothetical protein GCM10011384_22010 [Psychrobacillus lasiicapitis]
MNKDIVQPPNITPETKQAMLDFFVKHSLPNIIAKMDLGNVEDKQLEVVK